MDIQIHSEYITLAQLLKSTDLISSGGEAKYFLAEVKVLVNGETEQRRGRKLYPGDTVVISGLTYRIQAS